MGNYQKIEINDIHQGTLGNCYYLCSIAAVAEYPDRILPLFETKDFNKAGCYAVNCYIMGQKHTIILDDYFPYDTICNCAAFVKPNGHEIWVMLLEKAWAKVNGSYGNTVSGIATEGLNFLTGAPCEMIHHTKFTNKDDIWHKIQEADNKKFIMATSGSGPLPSSEYDKMGLVKNHAYSLIGAREINYEGNMVKLLQVRNPWGEKEWNGMWSDTWSGWTPELKRRCELVDRDDGTFYIQFEDFLNYFENTAICKYVETHVHSIANIKEKTNACYCFEVLQETEGCFEVITYSDRILRAEIPNYKPPVMCLLLAKIEGDTLRFINSVGCTDFSNSVNVKLTPGSYVLFTYAHYFSEAPKEYNIHGYFAQQLNFVEIEWHKEAFGETLIDYSRSIKEKWASQSGNLVCYSEQEFTKGFGLIYLRNETKDTKFKIDMDINWSGLQMLYPEVDGKVLSGTLLPGDEMVAVSKIASSDSIGIGTSLSYSYSGTKDKGKPRVIESVKIFINDILKKLKTSKPAIQTPVQQIIPEIKPTPVVIPASPAVIPEPVKIPDTVQPIVIPEKPNEPIAIPTPAQPEIPTAPISIPGEPIKPSGVVCGLGHNMVLRYDIPAQYFQCGICGNMNECKEGCFVDAICNIYYCQKCSSFFNPVVSTVDPTQFCQMGHELAFSNTIYAGGSYMCNRCYNVGTCATGRYHCDKCSYDICNFCRPAPIISTPTPEKNLTQCDLGHELKFSFFMYPSQIFACNKCRKNYACAAGRWFCELCYYDLCTDCMKGPEIKCPNNDPIIYTTIIKEKATYTCLVCKKTVQCISGALYCPVCNFTMCTDCLPMYLKGGFKLEKAEIPQCEDGFPFCDSRHPMQFSYACVKGYEYVCKRCGKTDGCAMGRWLCYKCDYNICEGCIKAPEIVFTNTANHYFCQLRHQLTFKIPKSGKTFTCIQCGKQKTCAGGAFWCKKCKVGKCPQCIPISFIPNATKCCLNGHPMVLTKAEGAEAKTFMRCAGCGKARQKCNSYHRCAFCDYNVCYNCLFQALPQN